jgi:hypothetical protein
LREEWFGYDREYEPRKAGEEARERGRIPVEKRKRISGLIGLGTDRSAPELLALGDIKRKRYDLVGLPDRAQDDEKSWILPTKADSEMLERNLQVNSQRPSLPSK